MMLKFSLLILALELSEGDMEEPVFDLKVNIFVSQNVIMFNNSILVKNNDIFLCIHRKKAVKKKMAWYVFAVS